MQDAGLLGIVAEKGANGALGKLDGSPGVFVPGEQ